MKKYILYIFLMAVSSASSAQETTTPQVVGIPSGSKMTVSFPFEIVGVSFSEIPNAVWYRQSGAQVKVELKMTYYMERDEKMYTNKRILTRNFGNGGSWSFNNLYIEPKPYEYPGRKMVEGKTHYEIMVYQSYLGNKSNIWQATINRVKNAPLVTPNLNHVSVTHQIPKQQPTVDKIPDQKLGPKVVHPKDKVILNPQPIPPVIKRKKIGN